MKKLGCVNPCNMLYLYDKDNNEIGQCLDTPNNFAVACYLNNKVSYGESYYEFFGTERKDREDYADRIEMVEKYYKKEEFDYHKQYIKFY